MSFFNGMVRICNAAFRWWLQGKRRLCINISYHHKSCHIQRRQGCELQYPTHQYAHPNLYQCNWLQEHQTCRHQIDDFLLQHYPLESGGNCAHDDWVHLILEKFLKTLVIPSCFRKVYNNLFPQFNDIIQFLYYLSLPSQQWRKETRRNSSSSRCFDISLNRNSLTVKVNKLELRFSTKMGSL